MRRDRLLRFAQESGCKAVATLEPENLFYLTGFWGEAVGLLDSSGRTTIIAPTLEVERARQESSGCDVVEAKRGSGMITELVSRIRAEKTCVDCRDYHMMRVITDAASNAVPSSEPFLRSRIIKDDIEMKILREASKIIDDMFGICVQEIRAGLREYELQGTLMSYAISQRMFDTGYRHTLNPLIVAGGPNGALPHAQVTERKFAVGDLIVVDITLRYRGYVSDATRTFALGKISRDAMAAYDVVQESQMQGLDAAVPGQQCGIVDNACRVHIDDSGYGRYFVHSTGHGIGLDVHEQPVISAGNTMSLEEGMAITVEPGVYIPDRFGIRIEDSIIIGKRPEVLHNFTKELITI